MIDSPHKTWLTLHGKIIIATALSVAFHAASFTAYLLNDQTKSDGVPIAREKYLKVSLAAIRPEAVQPSFQQELPVPAKPVVPKEVKTAALPKAVVEKIPAPVATKKPVARAAPKPLVASKPVKPTTDSSREITSEKRALDLPEATTAEPTPILTALPTILVEESISIEDMEQIYVSQLLEHIGKHKFYPIRARKKNIHGRVRISFVLDAEGKASQITINEGHRVLRKAAKKALHNALPLPRPPATVTLPKTISFGMTYRFKG